MPDHPVPEFDGKTPLEQADTPNLDDLSRRGLFGLASTIPQELPPGSDVGNLSVLGYDPRKYYTGRSPLEAASMGIELGPNDVSYRCNLVTLEENGQAAVMRDYSAGHISTEDANALITTIKEELGTEEIDFFPGISYRHLMLWHGGTDGVTTTPPHDISDKDSNPFLPSGEGSEKLLELIYRSREILKDHPVNLKRVDEGKLPATSIWLWGAGRAPKMPTFYELYGLTSSVISAVDLVKGIGVYAGMRVIEVPGATGYIDTNYEGKVEYALKELEEVDLVMIHIESTDETGHEGKPELKKRAVEDFDSRVVGPVLAGLKEKFESYKVMVLSDHPTPLDIKTHINEPVPFCIFDSDHSAVIDPARVYTESCAKSTGTFVDEGWKLMGMLLDRS